MECGGFVGWGGMVWGAFLCVIGECHHLLAESRPRALVNGLTDLRRCCFLHDGRSNPFVGVIKGEWE